MMALTNTVTLSLVRICQKTIHCLKTGNKTNLLWRTLIRCRPHINLLVDVDAGNDEEDPGAPGPPCEEPAQPEDDSPLVLLAGAVIIREVGSSPGPPSRP